LPHSRSVVTREPLNTWSRCPKTERECRMCKQSNPVRDTHIGDLCAMCWFSAPTCLSCGNRMLGGCCDICSMADMRQTQVLNSSAAGFMADHGVGSFNRSSAKTPRGEAVQRVRKTDRHVVRSKTPARKKNG
jgi:hypothetical protein